MIIATFGGDLKDKGVGVFGKKAKLFLFDSISFNVFVKGHLGHSGELTYCRLQ